MRPSAFKWSTYGVGVDVNGTQEGSHGDSVVTSTGDLLVLRNFVIRVDSGDGEALSDFQCVSNSQTEQLTSSNLGKSLTDVSDQLESDLEVKNWVRMERPLQNQRFEPPRHLTYQTVHLDLSDRGVQMR